MLLRASRVATAIPRTRFFVFPPLALLFGVALLMLISSAPPGGPAIHPASAAPALTNNHPNPSLKPNSIPLTSTPTVTCTVVPGTTDTGNHCDDCDTLVTLPFPVTLYNQTYSSVNVSSNGRLDFATVNDPGGSANSCLPAPPNLGPYDYTIFPYWDDLRTDCTGCGVFTALRGTTPNRTFVIEWRTNYRTGGTANFEVLLNEGPAGIDFIYGRVDGHGDSATVGVQGPDNLFSQYECDGGGIYEGLCLHFPLGPPPVQTSTPTGTPTRTPTCLPPSWPPPPNLPIHVSRNAGVWFPPTGKFYSLGGSGAQPPGMGVRKPYAYDPVANTWTTSTAQMVDALTSNVAAEFLNGPNGPRIYIVGGSYATAVTNRVQVFDPVADTITELTTDPWPVQPIGQVLPGGSAVYNNKLYILGGFDVSALAGSDTIWEFDPNRPDGSRWRQMNAHLPVPLAYIPVTTIGNYIYTAGGDRVISGTLVDSSETYRYDPQNDTITNAIAQIPRITGETRAVNVDGEMWVLGGGRVSPNPSNEVDIYSPSTNSWSFGLSFVQARRNLGAAVNPGDALYMVGGYSPVGPADSMEIYHFAVPCGTATPSPTPTGTPTRTPTCLPPSWPPPPTFPVTVIRSAGVWFPPTGKFYSLGGRTSDTVGTGLRNPYAYDPATNSWAMSSAQMVDGLTSNVAAEYLNGPDGPRIYIVGGSDANIVSNRVQVFDPVADTIIEMTTDPWPVRSDGQVVPGGSAVYNNKLYILGGIAASPLFGIDTIWEFDPNRPDGSRWRQMNARLPMPLAYIPVTTIGNYIYTAGGERYDGVTLQDTTETYRYDPQNDAITDAIAQIPRFTGETRAVNIFGQMWVLGGGRTAPNPSNEVDIYNPGSNTWSVGAPLVQARRNFAAAVNPGVALYIVGGYVNNGSSNSMLIYHFGPPCSIYTPTATRTPTPAASPTCGVNYLYATATATIAPGATDTGNHCDDCTTPITLPFSFRLYDLDFTTASVSSNGYLQFGYSQFDGNRGRVTGSCPPPGVTYTILPYWDDLRTDQVGTGCTSFPGGCGIFTSVSGAAPNRIFNIEWRVVYYGATTTTANFEIRLYENAPGQQFDFVYGRLDMCCAVGVGVVKDSTSYTCYTGNESQGLKITWTLPPCATATATPTSTCTLMPTSTPASTPCPMSFTDVQPTDYFYEPVRYLYCRGVISGYGDNTFRPYNNTTRGQFTKIVVLGFGIPTYAPPTPTFRDVPTTHTFYEYIETASRSNLVSGYACGGPGEPCPGLYFRPGNLVTRGQLSKIVVLAAGWPLLDPSTPTFQDVPPGSPFFRYVETAYARSIISGYTCGPSCLEFRPANPATRSQVCKIVYLTITRR